MNSTIMARQVKQDEIINFTLDVENGVPIYRQIIQQIEFAILSRRAKPGDKLPTIRQLAVDLKTNPNTIARAYSELEIRGILATQVGSGTYISDKESEPPEDARSRRIREELSRFLQQMFELGLSKKEIFKMIESYNTEGKNEKF
ncbi:MAG: GntR family transcriptional regulator [Treponema sp.]|nr:GntR family transcriptional regulator [Treponema sp.]